MTFVNDREQPPDLSKAGSRQPRRVTRLALLLGGDVVDDLRFQLHLPNDLADLFLRQLCLGEADAVEPASRFSGPSTTVAM